MFQTSLCAFVAPLQVTATSWFPLGPVFLAAGVAHFTQEQGFLDMYPHRGAWGIWQLPGRIACITGGFNPIHSSLARFQSNVVLVVCVASARSGTTHLAAARSGRQPSPLWLGHFVML